MLFKIQIIGIKKWTGRFKKYKKVTLKIFFGLFDKIIVNCLSVYFLNKNCYDNIIFYQLHSICDVNVIIVRINILNTLLNNLQESNSSNFFAQQTRQFL